MGENAQKTTQFHMIPAHTSPGRNSSKRNPLLFGGDRFTETPKMQQLMTIPPRKFFCVREVVVHLFPVWHRALMQQELRPIK